MSTSVLEMTWDEYFKAVCLGPGFRDRLEVIKLVRRALTDNDSFATIDPRIKQVLAGCGKKWYHGLDVSDKLDVWYFGTNARRSELNDDALASPALAEAVGSIPLSGEVLRQHYETFVVQFKKAFPHGAACGVVTRFLAIIRPDVFIVINNASENRLAAEFGGGIKAIRETWRTNWKTYWPLIVQRVKTAPWWVANEPSGGTEREVWNARAAMGDCIYRK